MSRKQKTIHYLYKTTCKVTGKYYIGMHSTSNLDDDYMGSGKRLRYSIRKYGKENHVKEILEFFDCREDLVEAEKKAITEDLLCNENCMNLMSGGTGGFISEEQQKYRSQCGNNAYKLKLETDPQFKQHIKGVFSKFFKELHKDGIKYYTPRFTGKKHSEESKKKISSLMKGKGIKECNSQYGTCWITNGNENKKVKKDVVVPDGWYKGRT